MDVYVMKDGRRQGPYQLFRLTEMLEEGALSPQDVVWHEGMKGWQPLEDTESLRGVLRDKAAPAPAPVEKQTANVGPRPGPAAGLASFPYEAGLAVLRQRRALAWRRFFARQIDMTIAAAGVVALAAALGWTDMWAFLNPYPPGIIIAPALVWILVETVMLSTCGWTPGRLILGLRVVMDGGVPPSPGAALKRSALVWAGGLGFGLPVGFLLPVAQWLYTFWHFQQRGETLWDRAAGTRVAFRPLHGGHAAGLAIITAAVASLFCWLVLVAPFPARFNLNDREPFEQFRNETLKAIVQPVRD